MLLEDKRIYSHFSKVKICVDSFVISEIEDMLVDFSIARSIWEGEFIKPDVIFGDILTEKYSIYESYREMWK